MLELCVRNQNISHAKGLENVVASLAALDFINLSETAYTGTNAGTSTSGASAAVGGEVCNYRPTIDRLEARLKKSVQEAQQRIEAIIVEKVYLSCLATQQ